MVYDPDLNDGVVLNIAPLWELVPWKEAKNYWEELLEGKYEWSSMGKLLRKKGLVEMIVLTIGDNLTWQMLQVQALMVRICSDRRS